MRERTINVIIAATLLVIGALVTLHILGFQPEVQHGTPAPAITEQHDLDE